MVVSRKSSLADDSLAESFAGKLEDLPGLAAAWTSRLCPRTGPVPPLPGDLSTITLEESNQRVIKYDCERTRSVIDEFRTPEVRLVMEQLLTFYCRSYSVKYKQGMNEVLAPFVYLKLFGGIATWPDVYALYSAFIDRFLPNMFTDDEFQFLQRSCVLFRACLRYHAPALSSRLDAAMVTPEMYVTPWFLTLFASKTSLPTVIHLWDLLITQGDTHSFVFVSISLCVSHARILRASAKSSLPETITKISITEDSVVSCWRRAVKMRQHTPPFFTQQLISAAETGEEGREEARLAPHLQKQLGDIYPMTIRPMDLFRCANKEGWRYVVLDCRPQWAVTASAAGSLPLSIPFDLESLVAGQSVFPVSDALKKVADLLGVDVSDTAVPQWPIENHICLMGLTDGQIDACGLLYLALAKFSNVPRVSILKGGFEAVHNDLPQELIDHDPVTCSMCNGLPLSQLADRKPRLRAGSNASSSYADSSVASSPVSASSPSNGSLMQKFKSFVSESSSVVASSTGSFLLNSGSRFLVGSTPPIPASRVWFAPAADQLVQKCRLTEVLGRSPSSDIEAHALLVVGKEGIRCYAAPLDMTVLTANCELRLYGSWRVVDLCKITSKDSQPAALLFYFSVESDPDLVVTMINGDVARSVVDDVRRKYRQAKKGKN